MEETSPHSFEANPDPCRDNIRYIHMEVAMKIEHVALWTSDLEGCKDFFTEFFGGKAGARYMNPKTGFQSYFIGFDSGTRLEIMHKEGLAHDSAGQTCGYSHMAFSLGSIQAVDQLTDRLRKRGLAIVREPGYTGDGYYESCFLDADNNRIELTE